MFEWLVDEMTVIKTRKFHLVDGPASGELREAVLSSEFPLPPSYREFVLRFGNARLYRSGHNWLVEVYAGPREAETDDGEALIHFGRTHTSLAYFKESMLLKGKETPVFEWRYKQGVRRTAIGFAEWLTARCVAARRRYKKKEWQAVLDGPPPFSDDEQAIVDARKQFRWRLVGIAPNDDLEFEVHNGSNMLLPFLSIGIRGKLRPPKSGPLTGGVFLPVATINPGETKVIEKGCYKELITREDVEAFPLPDPGPEDREQYWEFRSLTAVRR